MARNAPPISTVIIDPPDDGADARIALLPAAGDFIFSTRLEDHPQKNLGRVACVASATSAMSQFTEEWARKLPQLIVQNAKIICLAMSDLIANARTHRNPIRLRSRLGVLTWQTYWWQPKEAIDQPIVPFMENLKDERTQGRLLPL